MRKLMLCAAALLVASSAWADGTQVFGPVKQVSRPPVRDDGEPRVIREMREVRRDLRKLDAERDYERSITEQARYSKAPTLDPNGHNRTFEGFDAIFGRGGILKTPEEKKERIKAFAGAAVTWSGEIAKGSGLKIRFRHKNAAVSQVDFRPSEEAKLAHLSKGNYVTFTARIADVSPHGMYVLDDGVVQAAYSSGAAMLIQQRGIMKC